jgi:hypothetical protein
VLDNKEQENLSKELSDYCLFLSTGAGRKRSSSDGSQVRSSDVHRPAVVITSIEGVGIKSELTARILEVEFAVAGQKIGREEIEIRIDDERNTILSALMPVLQKFFEIRAEHRQTPNPFNGNHSAHFGALCDLLRAYGVIAGKEPEWSEGMIKAWDVTIRGREESQEETSPLEFPLRQLLLAASPLPNSEIKVIPKVEYRGRPGTLCIASGIAFILDKLQSQPSLHSLLPKTPHGFSRRLKSERFRALEIVREEDAPQFKDDLKRSSTSRAIGFFVPDDARDVL